MEHQTREMQMLRESLVEKWSPLLESRDFDPITSNFRKQSTAVLLENQSQALNLTETSGAPGTVTANSTNWDPILMSLVRRSAPKMIAYDVCGVQPMTGPVGLIFAMRATYGRTDGTLPPVLANEALFNEARTSWSGAGDDTANVAGGTDFGGGTAGGGIQGLSVGRGFATSVAEVLGSTGADPFREMSLSIDSTTVTSKSRALKAEYSHEIQQDMKAIHGQDADKELANILTQEILAEINREVIRTMYQTAKTGSQSGTTVPGIYNLDVDSNGRWSVERFKGLMFQLQREANVIARETRRGKGNFVICSSDTAAALQMAGVLDYTPAITNNLEVDDTGNTFAGTLNTGMKVFIDPYHSATAANDFMCVGYKGTSQIDAGMFYCPYIPLQMYRAVGEDTFQPKIGFKTRYGLVNNPFVVNAANDAVVSDPTLTTAFGRNQYYRFSIIHNLV